MKHLTQDHDRIRSFYEKAIRWWGVSWYDGENLKNRLDLIIRYAGNCEKRILELGAGPGETAAFLCDQGYSVLAVDLCPGNIGSLRHLAIQRPGLRCLEGDFLTVNISESFPIVCMFETFGLGSDRDQKALLRRISDQWLIPGGVMIMDVYHPIGPIQASGTRRELDRLEHVPGSVAMTDYSFYDPVKNRWIDIWEPREDKASTATQSIRCYTPADFMLVADGSGLTPEKMLYKGNEFDFDIEEPVVENIFENAGADRIYSYQVVLRKQAK